MTVTCTRNGVRTGFRSTLPLGLPVAAYGAVFGLLAQQARLSALEATLLDLYRACLSSANGLNARQAKALVARRESEEIGT